MNIKLISLLTVLLLGSIAFCVKVVQDNQTLKHEKNNLIDYALADSAQLEWYKNKFGEATAKVTVLELSRRDSKDLSGDSRLSKAKKFKGVKDNLKNVENIVTINSTISNEWAIDNALLTQDTTFKSLDGLNSLEIDRDGDTTTISQRSNVELTGAILWTRKWFLGRKRWTFDLSSNNSQVTITGLEFIRIGKK